MIEQDEKQLIKELIWAVLDLVKAIDEDALEEWLIEKYPSEID